MNTLVLDTHIVQWLSAEPEKLSKEASSAIDSAEILAVAAISWYELAWLARNGRISVTVPIRSWLEELSKDLQTIELTPAIADTATSLPSSFPGDPADRIIYATAIETGAQLVTKDQKLRQHPQPRKTTVW